MTYPKFNGKKLKAHEQKEFSSFFNRAKESITFDRKEFSISLTKTEIELLSWNVACMLYSFVWAQNNSTPLKTKSSDIPDSLKYLIERDSNPG